MSGQFHDRKIALMGFRSVGKSSLSIQFTENRFIDSYDPTIENTFTKDHKYLNKQYRLSLVDTAGQDEYSLVPRSYAVDIDGYVFVYAIDSLKSFQVVQSIHEKILELVGKSSIPLVLVANKSDLGYEREVSFEVGKSQADAWKVPFCEVSAKDGNSVTSVFEKILHEIERMSGNLKPEPKPCVIS